MQGGCGLPFRVRVLRTLVTRVIDQLADACLLLFQLAQDELSKILRASATQVEEDDFAIRMARAWALCRSCSGHDFMVARL